MASLCGELPAAFRGTGLRAYVGGATAEITDLTSEINAKTPPVIAVSIAIALLAAAFCSPWSRSPMGLRDHTGSSGIPSTAVYCG